MFCVECGTKLSSSVRGGRERPTCPACGWVLFSPAPVGVAAVILDQQNRILLVRRSTSFRAGMWCLPCGYLEADEELRAGLQREIAEETGLQTRLGEIVAVHSNTDRDPPFPVGIWIRAHIVGGTLQANDDVDAVEFFDLYQLPDSMAFATDLHVIEQLKHAHADASVQTLTQEMHNFVQSKGWYKPDSKRPQTPRNLAISLSLEVAEVLEYFQWNAGPQSTELLSAELADVALYLLQLADVSGINLVHAIRTKLHYNQTRIWDMPDSNKENI